MASIDLTFLTGFTGGNKDKMAKYIGIFLQSCPGQLSDMSKSLTEGNYDRLRATAHAIKPQITYMGIKKAESLIRKIETLAEEKSEVETLPKLLNEFETMCNEAMIELKKSIE